MQRRTILHTVILRVFFPKVKWVRGRTTSKSETLRAPVAKPGIDLELRVVERYFGTNVAATAAEGMEHVHNTPRPWS